MRAVTSKPSVDVIRRAVQGLYAFCSRQSVPMGEMTIVPFSIAWREGGTYEWPVRGRGITRIDAVNPDEHQGNVVVVHHTDHERGVALTDELNRLIRQLTENEWA